MIFNSGDLIRRIAAGEKKDFMNFYNPEEYMEIGTAFIKLNGDLYIILKDGVRKIDGGWDV
nr:MAG TPA: hypothetical protein [Caudoviricetes sp.]